jgi:hypothetical protein
MTPRSIGAINRLSEAQKRAIYSRFIPQALLDQFDIPPTFEDDAGRDLLSLRCRSGTSDVTVDLRHVYGAIDPLLYAHLTDTLNGQIHVLLYIVNDPHSPRFDVDRMPDGTPTEFGSEQRNIPAEIAAMEAGLAPGQVRKGLRILKHSIAAFEDFVASLNHDLYFNEPLFYHNAVVFERYGFAYQKGRRLMEEIQAGFEPDGVLTRRLDGSSPFRHPSARTSIRGRSWAIHDGILGKPFTEVTMYKRCGEHARLNTFPGGTW